MFDGRFPHTVRGMTNISNPLSDPNRPAGDTPITGVEGINRAGALAGLAGAFLYVISGLVPGSAPKPAAGASTVIAYFADKRGSLLTGFVLEIIALGLLVCFLGQIRRLTAGSGAHSTPISTAMTAAWVILMTTVLAGTLPALALVWQGPPFGDPGLVRMAYDVEILATYAATATVALVSVGAPSIAIWRSRILPRWLALLGVAGVVVNVVEIAGLASRHGALAGGYADGIGALLWALWVAATSVCMARLAKASKEPYPPENQRGGPLSKM
jgi:hypothetical protein